MGLSSLVAGDPRELGDYLLSGRLGSGGQGVVYEAYDPRGERVAIKVLHAHLGSNREMRARFAKEAQAARRVASFCTARVLATRLDGTPPYIVSEFVDGPSLRQAIERAGPYRGDSLHRVATGIITALTAIHQAGVIHRDLKPDNVLLGSDGPRVVDFGIARTSEMSLTTASQIAGTPLYLAPEVATGSRAEESADVWAWGLVVLYAATGRHAFAGDSVGEVLQRILTVEPERGDLPEPLRSLVGAALAKKAAERPSAAELLFRLVGGHSDPLEWGSRQAEDVRPPEELMAAPSLDTMAEQVYEKLEPPQRAMAPDLLLRLVMPSTGATDLLRSVSLAELRSGDDDADQAVDQVVDAFTAAGLVVVDEDEVTLASAALIRAWPRMREWIDTDREGLLIHHRMSDAARLWHAHGRRSGDLYQGSPLEIVLQWAATGRHLLTLNPLERDYLNASSALTRSRARRRKGVTAVLAVLLAISLGAAGLAEQQRREVNAQRQTVARQRDEAVARQLVTEAQTLRSSDPVKGMLLTVSAWRLAHLGETRAGLYNSLAQPELDVFVEPPVAGGAVYAAGNGGATLVSVSGGRARVWDTRAHRQIGGFGGLDAGVIAASLSPDGRTLAVGSARRLRLWDVASGRPEGEEFGEGVSLGAGIEAWWPGLGPPLAFSPSGRALLVRTETGGRQVWDIGAPGKRALLLDRAQVAIGNVSVAPGDRIAAVVTDSGPTGQVPVRLEVWDLVARRRLRTIKIPDAGQVRDLAGLAFSPDARILAISGESGVRLLDVATGAPLGAIYQPAADPSAPEENVQLTPVVFSDDGRFFATVNETGETTVVLWRVGFPGRPVLRLVRDPSEIVSRLWFEPGSAAVRYVSSGGATVRLDVAAATHPPALGTSRAAGLPVRVFSPDGRLVAVQGAGRQVQVWDARLRQPIGAPLEPETAADGRLPLMKVAFSRDGRILVAVTDPVESVTLWDTGTRRRIDSFRLTIDPDQGGSLFLSDAELSADGKTLALVTISADGAGGWVHLFDVPSRRHLAVAFSPQVAQVAFRPGGGLVAAGGTRSPLVELPSLKVITKPFGPGITNVGAVAFSPDGATLATIVDSGRIILWDAKTRRQLGLPFETNGRTDTNAMTFSPDGQILATSSDGEVRLWDTVTHRQLGPAYSRHTEPVQDLAFSSDGGTLYSVGEDGLLNAYTVDPARAVAEVCARAGRDITPAEWRRHLGDIPYRRVCT